MVTRQSPKLLLVVRIYLLALNLMPTVISHHMEPFEKAHSVILGLAVWLVEKNDRVALLVRAHV